MSKTTFDLYRVEAIEWADLLYSEALEVKIKYAKKSMRFYKSLADTIGDKFQSENYIDLVKKFKDSEKARDFNILMLDELKGIK